MKNKKHIWFALFLFTTVSAIAASQLMSFDYGKITSDGSGNITGNLASTNIVAQTNILTATSAVTNYTVNLLQGGLGNMQVIYLANTNCFITFTGTNTAFNGRSVIFAGGTNTVVSSIYFALGNWHTNTTANYYITNGYFAVFNIFTADASGTNILISDGGRWR
jgi:hypothetical protein